MRSLTWVVLLFTVLSLISLSQSQQASTTETAVPSLINYSGTVALHSGSDVVPKTVGITFAIYRQQDGGAPLWLETQNVTTDASGNYSVLLGSTTATGLPSDLFSQQEQRWLGVQVQGQRERLLHQSVPIRAERVSAWQA